MPDFKIQVLSATDRHEGLTVQLINLQPKTDSNSLKNEHIQFALFKDNTQHIEYIKKLLGYKIK